MRLLLADGSTARVIIRIEHVAPSPETTPRRAPSLIEARDQYRAALERAQRAGTAAAAANRAQVETSRRELEQLEQTGPIDCARCGGLVFPRYASSPCICGPKREGVEL